MLIPGQQQHSHTYCNGFYYRYYYYHYYYQKENYAYDDNLHHHYDTNKMMMDFSSQMRKVDEAFCIMPDHHDHHDDSNNAKKVSLFLEFDPAAEFRSLFLSHSVIRNNYGGSQHSDAMMGPIAYKEWEMLNENK
jgi:hypothetical protein